MNWTPDDLVVIVPILGREHRVAPTVESVSKTVPAARLLFIPDPDDDPVRSAISDAGAEEIPSPGNWAAKINLGISETEQSLIFTGADDLRFHEGWFEAATAKLSNPKIGVVGTNDLGNPRVKRGQHATHFLVTRAYAEWGTIDEPGKLLHEGYPHEYVDDELIATARARGAWAMALDSHVEHLHPAWGKADERAKTDPIYAKITERMAAGREIFLRRRRLWA